jgi:hypothetical protein
MPEREGPVRIECAVAELVGGIQPALQMEAHVLTAGDAVQRAAACVASQSGEQAGKAAAELAAE